MVDRHVSVPKPFASGDATEWFKRFDICSTANNWNNATKALKLTTLLEGEALAIWLELSERERGDYGTARTRILEAMTPMGFVSLDAFHGRKLRPGEALSVFVHELKKLLDQAIPGLDADARDQLLLHQFLGGIPPAVSRQLRATGETKTLVVAVERARLLLALDSDAQTAAAISHATTSDFKGLQDQVAALTEQVAALTTATKESTSGGAQATRRRRCFSCGQTGHLLRDCPFRQGVGTRQRRCFACGRLGHFARDCRSGNGRGAPGEGNGRPTRQ